MFCNVSLIGFETLCSAVEVFHSFVSVVGFESQVSSALSVHSLVSAGSHAGVSAGVTVVVDVSVSVDGFVSMVAVVAKMNYLTRRAFHPL